MLDTLMNLVRQQSGDAIVNNPAIPNDRNDEAMQSVSDGIMGGLQQQAQGGNIGGLLSTIMGQGGGASMQNPVVGGIANSVIGNLMGRFGLNQGAAAGIASSVVPMVLSQLFSRAQDPNDSSVDMGGLMSQATGNPQAAGVDWMGAAQSAMRDGQLDMNDLMRAAGGATGGGSQQQSDGGLGGMLGGLFGGR